MTNFITYHLANLHLINKIIILEGAAEAQTDNGDQTVEANGEGNAQTTNDNAPTEGAGATGNQGGITKDEIGALLLDAIKELGSQFKSSQASFDSSALTLMEILSRQVQLQQNELNYLKARFETQEDQLCQISEENKMLKSKLTLSEAKIEKFEKTVSQQTDEIQLLDLKCRSMRDSFVFYQMPEESVEDHSEGSKQRLYDLLVKEMNMPQEAQVSYADTGIRGSQRQAQKLSKGWGTVKGKLLRK